MIHQPIIRLLGQPRIEHETACQLPPSRKLRALLAYIALHPRALHRQELARLLWNGTSNPRASLRWCLSKLRPCLPQALRSTSDTVQIVRESVRIDVVEYQQLTFAALGLAQLQDIERAYADGYLVGVDDLGRIEYELWLQAERDQLRRQHTEVLAALTKASSANPAQALCYARKHVAIDPSHAAAASNFIRLSYTVGGRTLADAAMRCLLTHYRSERLDETPLFTQWHLLQSAITD
jgi:DNA-binding SARP family transcriptional activator